MQFQHTLALVDRDTTEHDFATMRQLRALVHYDHETAEHYLRHSVYQSGMQRHLTNPATLTITNTSAAVLDHSTKSSNELEAGISCCLSFV